MLFMVCKIVHLESYAVCLSSPTSTVRAHAKTMSSCYSKQSAVSFQFVSLPSRAASAENVRYGTSAFPVRSSPSRLFGPCMGCIAHMTRNCLRRPAISHPVAAARAPRSISAMRLSESGRDAASDNATESAAQQPLQRPPWEAALSAMGEGGALPLAGDAGEGAEMVVIGKIIIDEFVLRWQPSSRAITARGPCAANAPATRAAPPAPASHDPPITH